VIYLDTSWLVKLYVDEEGAGEVRTLAARDVPLAVSDVAYVEFHSAVHRRRREGTVSARTASSLLRRFHGDWTAFARVPAAQEVLDRAASLLGHHPLRSLDAIQLASALTLSRGSPDPLLFGCSDVRLRSAAATEGLTVLAP
jgi:predicted nucleic acid-binding protein